MFRPLSDQVIDNRRNNNYLLCTKYDILLGPCGYNEKDDNQSVWYNRYRNGTNEHPDRNIVESHSDERLCLAYLPSPGPFVCLETGEASEDFSTQHFERIC